MKIFTRLALCIAAGSLLLSGCSDGKDGLPGAAGKDATTVVKVSSLTTDQWAALAPKGEVLSVSINSPPVVKFKVTDANGNPVAGLAQTSKTSTNKLATYPNVSFSLAKLVPGKDGAPSKWVNYIVTAVSNATGEVTGGQRPSTENIGTLVDNGDGTYTYTFYRDITKVKDQIAALTDSGNNKKADLGDLTYDPNLTHRLSIQVSGAARGTGSNTADGSNSGVTSANIVDPANIIYDFVPATGKAVTSSNTKREIVTTANCNECHGKLNGLGFHGGSRNEARYCVVCHTDQRKYGQAAVTSTAGAFPTIATTVNASGSLSFDKTTYIADGEVQGDFPVFIHKIHMGNELKKTNYNYAGVRYDKMGYSMMAVGEKAGAMSCRKCHRGDTDAQKAVAPQANNWKDAPSRLACGTCHEGVNWATGTGHVGGSASNDQNCVLCHKAADVERYHTNDNATPNNPSTPAGAANFTYEIESVTVNASSQPVVKWRIKKDGVAVTSWPLSGFSSGPSFLVAYAVPQDGEAAPVDFNNNGRNSAAGTTSSQPGSVSLANLVNGTQGTLGAADANGFFTSTLTASAAAFPAGAKLRTVALQGYFTQDNLAANGRHTLSAVKAVSGETRRLIIDPTKCGACHEWFEGHGGNRLVGLGSSKTDTNVCVLCHNPNITSSGRTTPDAYVAAMSATDKEALTARGFGINAGDQLLWPEDTNNLKDMIHGIHAGKDRTSALEFVRNSYPGRASLTYWNFGRILSGTKLVKLGIGYPNLLKNCESCHNSGTYSQVPAGALVSTNLLDNATSPKTVASYTAARKTMPNTGFDLVTTPYTASCVTCHDSAAAQAHMTLNGGKIKQARANGMAAGEACMTCHGTGKDLDPAKVHK